MKKITQSEFIQRAIATHGVGTYDYSQAAYTTALKKVKIICPIHGLFEQPAINHTNGFGCKKCANTKLGLLKVKNTPFFIANAVAIHGDKYDYSKVSYRSARAKVEIICPDHGDFKQRPEAHVRGRGCWACQSTNPLVQSDFLERARGLHGDKYDYSASFYKTIKDKIVIICPLHGQFMQEANSHLNGNGCPACGKIVARGKILESAKLSWVERAQGKECILYCVQLTHKDEVFYKVGITYKSVKKRLYNKIGCYKYTLLARHTSHNASSIWDWEQSILETFAEYSYRPRFSFGGETECFSSADEILAIFPL